MQDQNSPLDEHWSLAGTPAERAKCNSTETCNPPLPGAAGYSSAELDFYACLNEFDEAVCPHLPAPPAAPTHNLPKQPSN